MEEKIMKLKYLSIVFIICVISITGTVAAQEDRQVEPCETEHGQIAPGVGYSRPPLCGSSWLNDVLDKLSDAVNAGGSRLSRVWFNGYAGSRPNYVFDWYQGSARPGYVSYESFSENYDDYTVGATIQFVTSESTTDCGLILEDGSNYYYYLEFGSAHSVTLWIRNKNSDTWDSLTPYIWRSSGWNYSSSENVSFASTGRLQVRINNDTALYYAITSTPGEERWSALGTSASSSRTSNASCQFEEAWLWEITDWEWRN
jgi:hypothetical protein